MNDRYTADTITSDALDALYDRLDRARDAAALHQQGLLTTAELYAVIEAADQLLHGEHVTASTPLVCSDERHAAKVADLEQQLARLREGEEPGYDPLIVPTPGQWIQQFNQATAEKRLEVVGRLIDAAERVWACTMNQHEERIHNGRHAEMALNEVRQTVTDMENTTGARTWAGWLRDAMKRGPKHCLLCATETKPEPASTSPAATEATEPDTAPPLPVPRDAATSLHRALGQLLGDEDAQAIGRVRELHREEYGCCAECTHESGVPYPCATIRALDGEEQPGA